MLERVLCALSSADVGVRVVDGVWVHPHIPVLAHTQPRYVQSLHQLLTLQAAGQSRLYADTCAVINNTLTHPLLLLLRDTHQPSCDTDQVMTATLLQT